MWAETPVEATGAVSLVLARVSFMPGARTAWPIHPCGQLLVAKAGIERVQLDGAPVLELHPGDTVAIEPGERHWHGAAEGHAFEHIEVHGVDEAGRGRRGKSTSKKPRRGAGPSTTTRLLVIQASGHTGSK